MYLCVGCVDPCSAGVGQGKAKKGLEQSVLGSASRVAFSKPRLDFFEADHGAYAWLAFRLERERLRWKPCAQLYCFLILVV